MIKALHHLRALALVISTFWVFGAAAFAQSQIGFEAVSVAVSTGKNIRIEVRVTGIDPPPAAGDITLTASRIDMGPDGMAMMASPLKPVPASGPGRLAFETEFSMAGRWALSITAQIKGKPAPVSGVVVFTAAERKSEGAPGEKGKIVYYRNPMGLADVSPVPKKDSMGMDYIPVYEDEVATPGGVLKLDPQKIQRAGVRTAKAKREKLVRVVRAPATITADESRLGVVTAKFSGFVEELFVPASGAEVAKGQKLMRVWIETNDILNKQADLTGAIAGGQRSSLTIEGAEHNLRIFGFSDETIADIKRAGRPSRSVDLYAPREGTVIDKPAVVGMRFESGDTLFRTADLASVWAMAQVTERDLGLLRNGQVATLAFGAYPGKTWQGRTALIYPLVNAATRTVAVRIVMDNPDGLLKPGLYADVKIEAEASAQPTVVVPDSAVLDSGTRRVAFIAMGEGRFEPRDVVLGARSGGFVEVRDGIAEGEDVVVAGNFLLDAESNLKAALAAFKPPEASQ